VFYALSCPTEQLANVIETLSRLSFASFEEFFRQKENIPRRSESECVEEASRVSIRVLALLFSLRVLFFFSIYLQKSSST
jgi:hypothetical protein